MIEKMHKYAFLVFHSEYKAFLKTLRGLGVVHVQQHAVDKEQAQLRDLLERREQAEVLRAQLLAYLPKEADHSAVSTKYSSEVLEEKMKVLSEELIHREELAAELRSNEDKAQLVLPWGSFDPEAIEQLKGYGHYIHFLTAPKDLFERSLKDLEGVFEVSNQRNEVYFVLVNGSDQSLLLEGVEEHAMPEESAEQLALDRRALQERETKLVEELSHSAQSLLPEINGYLLEIDNKLKFGQIFLSGEAAVDKKVIYMEGWVPDSDKAKMEAGLTERAFYFRELEIQSEDNIPIKLKNNFFTRLFEPITEMFSLPNYGEIDQTALFAPFFMLFFGMCFGDGGYGLLLFAVATIFKLMKKGSKDLLSLLQWLGGAAFVVGMLMGTFFGVQMSYAKPETYFLNQNNLMLLSVVIGFVQILFAKGVAAYKTKVQRGLKYSLWQFAWIAVLLVFAAYFAIPMLTGSVLSPAVKYTIYGLGGLSLLVAFFYNDPDKNPLFNFGSGLWTTYNMASGLLGDTLSYIRLFAIGLTGSILGGVFNTLAIEQTEGLNLFIRVPLATIILLIGHSLNIALAMIGSFVHPLRLTFVEYYKNSEFEGGGKVYDPFREVK